MTSEGVTIVSSIYTDSGVDAATAQAVCETPGGDEEPGTFIPSKIEDEYIEIDMSQAPQS
jgi:hypothetical protein